MYWHVTWQYHLLLDYSHVSSSSLVSRLSLHHHHLHLYLISHISFWSSTPSSCFLLLLPPKPPARTGNPFCSHALDALLSHHRSTARVLFLELHLKTIPSHTAALAVTPPSSIALAPKPSPAMTMLGAEKAVWDQLEGVTFESARGSINRGVFESARAVRGPVVTGGWWGRRWHHLVWTIRASGTGRRGESMRSGEVEELVGGGRGGVRV